MEIGGSGNPFYTTFVERIRYRGPGVTRRTRIFNAMTIMTVHRIGSDVPRVAIIRHLGMVRCLRMHPRNKPTAGSTRRQKRVN
jgi:hypothetical protein